MRIKVTPLLMLSLASHVLGYGNYEATYTNVSKTLKAFLLRGYDKGTPPTSARPVSYSTAGTDVSVEIVFFKLNTVDVASGHLEIKCWLRLNWYDTQLRWTPAEWDGVTQLFFHASSFAAPGDTDIWLPDVTPYSALEGFMASFDPAFALVNNEGYVQWSRPGMLKLMCRYSGLVNFPSDTLSCAFDMGGWFISGAYQGIIPGGAGADLTTNTSGPGYQLAADWNSIVSAKTGARAFTCHIAPHGQRQQHLVHSFRLSPPACLRIVGYQENRISSINVRPWVSTYDCCPNEPWPQLTYTIILERYTFFYLNFTLLPSVIFSLVSFAVFFMSFEVLPYPRCTYTHDMSAPIPLLRFDCAVRWASVSASVSRWCWSWRCQRARSRLWFPSAER